MAAHRRPQHFAVNKIDDEPRHSLRGLVSVSVSSVLFAFRLSHIGNVWLSYSQITAMSGAQWVIASSCKMTCKKRTWHISKHYTFCLIQRSVDFSELLSVVKFEDPEKGPMFKFA